MLVIPSHLTIMNTIKLQMQGRFVRDVLQVTRLLNSLKQEDNSHLDILISIDLDDLILTSDGMHHVAGCKGSESLCLSRGCGNKIGLHVQGLQCCF